MENLAPYMRVVCKPTHSNKVCGFSNKEGVNTVALRGRINWHQLFVDYAFFINQITRIQTDGRTVMSVTLELGPSSIFRALSQYHVVTATVKSFNIRSLKKFQTFIQLFNSTNHQRRRILKNGVNL
jgi:hypothetical protein